MSTPAQVTEEHIYTTAKVGKAYVAGEDAQAAQLIADGEAKACEQLRAEIADQVARFHEEIARRQQVVQDNKALDLQERDQLRADRDYNHKCINRLASATGTLGEKSERVVEVALSTIDQLRAELEKVYALVTPDGCDLAPRGLFETARAVTELRAEVERLKPYVSKAVLTHEGTMLCSPLVAVKFNEQTARAERAELRVKQLEESK